MGGEGERAGQLRVPKSFLLDYSIPLAPLPEQRRIVAKIEELLTRLEAGVAALERARTNLRRYKASVLKAACEGRLVPTEAELSRKGTASLPSEETPDASSPCPDANKLLARLEAGVAALERARANLRRYRASVLKAACDGKLVSTEAELSRKGTASLPSEETPDASSPCPDANKLLTRLEAGVAALERARANLRRYKASVLKAACGGMLVSTEAELAGVLTPGKGTARSFSDETPDASSPCPDANKLLTRLDAGVAALERARANLRRYKASVLKAACGGMLVPTEAELSRKGTASLPSEETPDASSPCPDANKLLARLDAGVAALERARANLRRYKASVLKAACGGILVPTEAELSGKGTASLPSEETPDASSPCPDANKLLTRLEAGVAALERARANLRRYRPAC